MLPVLAVLAGFFVYLNSTSPSPCHRGCLERVGPVLPTVATNLTPSGWIPLPYGDIQISVPATWTIGILDCPAPTQSDGWISLSGITANNPPTVCPSETTFPPNHVSLGPDLMKVTNSAPVVTVNGFDAYLVANPVTDDGPAYQIPFPSLDTAISLEGPMAASVLHTLTYSPRAVVLAGGSPPPIPQSWHRVAFGNISAAIPKSWPVLNQQGWGGCLPTNLSLRRVAVVLNAGTMADAPSCPPFPDLSVERPSEGLVIDTGRYGPTESEEKTSESCMDVNHLSVCPSGTDRYGVLVASVHMPNESNSLAIEVGLAGNGMTARTILRSLRIEHGSS